MRLKKINWLLFEEDLKKGLTCVQLAPKYGLSHAQLGLRLKKDAPQLLQLWKSAVRNRRSRKKYNWSEFVALSEKGFGATRISRITGADTHTILTALRRSMSKEEYRERHGIEKTKGGWAPFWFYNSRGERLASMAELRISTFLRSIRVKYKTQAGLLLAKKYFFPDFQIGKKFIEYLGLMNYESYKQKTLRKMKFYREHGICCLFLYPEDLKGDLWKMKIISFLN